MWLFQPRNQAWLFPALRQLWHRSLWPIAPLFLQVAVPVIHRRKKSLEVGRREPLDVATSGSLRFLLVNARQLGMAVGFCLTLALISMASGCDTSDDTDFPKSVALAKKTNRPLLLAFLGTDWSISSLKLDREVFDQAEFADDAKYNFLLCKLHFYQTQERSPEIIRQNEQLAVRYNIAEFPTVVVLSPAGEELGRIGYVPGGVETFAAEVNKLILKGRASASRE